MLRTYRYRLYPNKGQLAHMKQNAGACRFVYNWALETKKIAYEEDGTTLSWYDLNNRLKTLKKDHPFLQAALSQSLQQAVKRLHMAFQHFIRRTRSGETKQGYPKFKRRKRYRQSFDVPQFFTVDFAAQRVCLPKIGLVKTVFHRRFVGTPKTCTVVLTATNKAFISIVVDDHTFPLPKLSVNNPISVGIDLGLTTYITMSSGEKVENPRHLQNSLKRLQCLHRRVSKKKRGGRNREKARQRLARIYERVANQRADFQHKLSTQLIRENQAIMVETLNIRGLVRNRRIARSIADAAWSRFLQMLQYKAEWYGVTLIQVGRFAPTSKICHRCGFRNEALSLADREWTCPACKTVHDRDLNAANNIKLMGLISLTTPREPREEPVELSALTEALKQETSPIKVE